VAYSIEFKPSAVRQFSKLPESVQTRLARKVDSLAKNPRPRGVKKLSGGEDLYRIRFGEYRVIYQIRDDVLLVLVVKIGARREVYRSV
jgi:mRNA interferase RelE/StbE